MNHFHHQGSQSNTKENPFFMDAVVRASPVYSIATEEERGCLAQLAREVPDQGLIVEIGCLYGGVTAVLALSNPSAAVIAIDDFSWHPGGCR